MKTQMINTANIEGYLYAYSLDQKPGSAKHPDVPYITGTISIVTDEALTNVITISYPYVTEKTSKDKVNRNYNILSDILTGKLKSVMEDGVANAVKLKVSTSIALNEFYSDRNGPEELVSVMQNRNGFITIVSNLNENERERNTFKTDIVINKVTHKDADPDRGEEEKALINGAIFDYGKNLLPVTFVATHPAAIAYFEGLDASPKNPVFTCVWGRQISETIKRKVVEESAFGEDDVHTVTSTRKAFLVEHAAKETYDWDDPKTLTKEELETAISNREIYKAELKQRRADAIARKNSSGANSPRTNTDEYDF